MFKLCLSNGKSTSLLLACIVTFISPLTITAQQKRRGDQKTRAGGAQKEFALPLEEQKRLKVTNVTKPSMTMLINVFDRLAPSQKHNLGPVTQPERRKLLRGERGVRHSKRIGVIRRLARELKVTKLTPAVAKSNLTAVYAGGRVDIKDNKLAWTTEISSPGATGIRVEIENISLPPDAIIFVTDGVRQLHGLHPPSRRTILMNTVFGSKVYVQVQIPSDSTNQPTNAFTISEIAHLEEDGEERVRRSPGGGNVSVDPMNALVSCGLEILCRPANPSPNPSPEDILLETASLGVARINYRKGRGVYNCSGGLLSDRRGSNTPFFLTASHCLNKQEVADTLEAHWVFRQPCGQREPDYSTFPSTIGSTLLATSPDNDFTLVQLSQAPPVGSHFFRWSPEDISNTTTMTYRVHHPLGYAQHMQRSTVEPSNCERQGYPDGVYLSSKQLKGETEVGSSGSLLFRAEGNTPVVVGQLYGACSTAPLPACGYWNVDGSFAHTFWFVQRFLDDTPVAERPVIDVLRPNHNTSLPANSTVEVVARITGTTEITTAEMYWQRSQLFMRCPATGEDWSCSKQGNEYKWVLNVTTGSRTFYIRAADAQGNWNFTSKRTIQLN